MFDIHQSIHDEHGEIDHDRVEKYVNGLSEEFAASSEAKPIIEKQGDISFAPMMMEYGVDYLGVTPANMTLRDFNEVVFELFPRKVSTPPESAPAIIAELRAFWQFVQRQYDLDNAWRILKELDDEAIDRLEAELANPANYGTAKSFFMMGSQAGFDMTTQEGLDAFTAFYNSNLPNRGGLPPAGLVEELDDEEDDSDEPSGLQSAPARLSSEERKAKRRAKKAQRKARKRNRR